jgi:triacylglycerol lipase
MIARITKVLLAVQLLAAMTLCFASKAYGFSFFPAMIFGVVAVLVFRLLITANNFFLAWIYRSPTPVEHRISFSKSVALVFNEFKATMLTSSWTMPFCSFSRRITPGSNTLPVLLVHGYVCNSGQWQTISDCLIKNAITHYAIDLQPVLGSIDSYVPLIDSAVHMLCSETGSDKVIIIAHSMGGLAVRAYMRDNGSMHIAKIITLGTPHHGTALANFGKGENSRQMRLLGRGPKGVSSNWLQQLEKDENQLDYAHIVSIYSHHDNIISPQTSSHLIGARNIALHGIGHVALTFDKTVQEKIISEIQMRSNQSE